MFDPGSPTSKLFSCSVVAFEYPEQKQLYLRKTKTLAK